MNRTPAPVRRRGIAFRAALRAVRRAAPRAALLSPLLALVSSVAGAGTHRLSEGLPFSDVLYFQNSSPDGRYAVYSHDAVVDGAHELWSVPVSGGDPVRLSGLLPAGAYIEEVAISPDSQRVVYTSPQETAGKFELYSIAVAGPEGSWIKLSGSLPPGSHAARPRISPDGAQVVYLVVDSDDRGEVWTVPIGGGSPLRLRPTLVPIGASVQQDSIRISPDSQRVVFVANYAELSDRDLWSARIDGTGSPIRISSSQSQGGQVMSDFRISDDSARVAYLADQDAPGIFELFSVPIGGGTIVQLNGALVSGGEVSSFKIAPGSARAVYLADQQTNGVLELYSVPLAGGAATKLNGPMVSEGDVRSFAIAPDGGRAVYIADQGTDEMSEIYSAPLLGGSWVKLNSMLPLQGTILDFEIAPDSSRVVYFGELRSPDVWELFSVPIAGGARVRVSDDPVLGGDVSRFRIAPTSDAVDYIADLHNDEKFELYRAEIASSAHADILLSGSMGAQSDVDTSEPALLLHPDGRQVIFRADAESPGQSDLYVGDPCLLCDGFEAGFIARWD